MSSRRRSLIKPRFFDLATAVSLLLCVVIGFLWVRSYFRADIFGDTVMPREGANWYWRNRTAFSMDGGLWFDVHGVLVSSPRFADKFAEKVGERYYKVKLPRQVAPRNSFAVNHWFVFDRRVKQKPSGSYVGPEVLQLDIVILRLPYWPGVLLIGALPTFWIVQRRCEARRARTGHCLHCGYSLTGNTSGVCPECGEPVTSAPNAPAR